MNLFQKEKGSILEVNTSTDELKIAKIEKNIIINIHEK